MPLATLASGALARSPLRHASFRVFYVGAIGAALGYTMQTTVAAWLMATLTTSPVMVALVQTAATAPALLFGLVGGAMADIVDRRHVILATQVALIAATVLLGVLAFAGWAGPATLLALTFVVGAAFAFYQPAQQASVNDLVTRAELPQAVSLNAVAFNVSRAIGPALAGALTAWLGSGSALIASAAFFVLMVVAVRSMKPRERALPGVPGAPVLGRAERAPLREAFAVAARVHPAHARVHRVRVGAVGAAADRRARPARPRRRAATASCSAPSASAR